MNGAVAGLDIAAVVAILAFTFVIAADVGLSRGVDDDSGLGAVDGISAFLARTTPAVRTRRAGPELR